MIKKTIVLALTVSFSIAWAQKQNTNDLAKVASAVKSPKVDLNVKKSLQKIKENVRIGNEGGGGGDATAIEFKNIADDLISVLSAGKANLKFSQTAFNKAVETVSIETTKEQLFVNSVRKDAKNFPDQNRIVLNLDRWQVIDTYSKMQLVAHEILGIMKVDDLDYQTSSAAIETYFMILNGSVESGLAICTFIMDDKSNSTLVYLSDYVNLADKNVSKLITHMPDKLKFKIIDHETTMISVVMGKEVQQTVFKAKVLSSSLDKLPVGAEFWTAGIQQSNEAHFDCK